MFWLTLCSGFPTQANATLINTSTQDIRITLTIRYEDDDGDSAVPRFDLEKVEKAPLGACDSCTFWVSSCNRLEDDLQYRQPR